MHRLGSLVDEAIVVLLDDLEQELAGIKHLSYTSHDRMIHEVRETLDAIGDAVHIKYHMGWLEDSKPGIKHNPY